MIYVHPAEVTALQQRVDQLEAELVRKREVISGQADIIATLSRAVRVLERQLRDAP